MEFYWEIDGAVIAVIGFGTAMMLILAMMYYDTWKEEQEFRKHASKHR
jgi:hypothetical protein